MQIETILLGNVFTGRSMAPFAGGVAIAQGRIQAVLPTQRILAMAQEGTRIYSAGDGLIMPGMIEGHLHLFIGAVAASEHMTLAIGGAPSAQACLDVLKDYAAAHPQEARIRAQGWNPFLWSEGMPSLAQLDAAIPDRPAYILTEDGHACWLNTLAIKELGGDPAVGRWPGDMIPMADGAPSGVVSEYGRALLDLMYDFPAEQLAALLRAFMLKLARVGITTSTDLDTTRCDAVGRLRTRALEQLEQTGALPARACFYLDLRAMHSQESRAQVARWQARYAGDRVWLGGCKQLVDGVTTTYTAMLLEPYADQPDVQVAPFCPPQDLARWTAHANDMNLGVRLHCIADASTRIGLTVFEEAAALQSGAPSTLPNCIEHIESLHPDDLARFAQLGVVASMQPSHLPLDEGEKLIRLGAARCRYEWPLRSLLDAGAPMAFGSDYPVADYNPFLGIHAAVTRCDLQGAPTGENPQERILMHEALMAYTAGAAHCIGRAEALGTLEVGKYADITVLDRNLFAVMPDEIPSTRVLMTMVQGEIIYEKEADAGA